MIDLSNLPEGTPIWLTGVAGTTLVILTLWERLKDIRGPLGALARWWHTRQIREVERRATLNQRIEQLVVDRVQSETQSMRKSIEDLTRQVGELQEARLSDKARIAELEDSRSLWSAFATELTAILFRARQTLAEHGLEMSEPIPKFSEFRARVRDPT